MLERLPPRARDVVRRVARVVRRGTPERFSARRVRLDYPRAEILLSISTRRELLGRAQACAKEPWTVAWLERELRPDDAFWDIGANVGGYSLIAAKIGGGARVVAIEPSYSTFAALCRNVLLNGVEDVVAALPLALAAETQVDSLAYSDVAPGAASHALGSGERAPSDAELDTVFRQTVLTFRLDDLLASFELPPPTLVKLDVDGGEGAVLAGAAATLARPELRSVLVEIERDGEKPVLEALERAGLTLRERFDERDGQRLKYHWYGVFGRN